MSQLVDPQGRPLRTRRRLELRAPNAATRLLNYQGANVPMVPEWDARRAVQVGYYGTPYLWRAFNVRADAIAGLPIRAGAEPPADPTQPGDHDPNAPVLRFLAGNPQVSRTKLLSWSMLQRDVTGRYAWELELDGRGRPLRPWPLVSANLDPIPSTGGERFFERYEYRTAANDSAPIRRLAYDRVHYDWRPSMLDWRQPESLLQAARLPVSTLIALDAYAYGFLANGGMPSHLVVHEEFAEEDDETAFRTQFNSEYGGPANAGKTMFVPVAGDEGAKGAIEIHTLGLSQRDARAVETYAQEVRAVSVATGVPLSKLGDSSERTFDNAKQEDRNFWEMMVDVAREFADGINRELAPRNGAAVVWFDFSEVEALKPPSRFQAVNLPDVLGKVVTVNEGRAEVGLAPVPGGDDLAEEAPAPLAMPDPAPELPAPVRSIRAADSTGAMVALVPTPEDARRLALPEGVPGAEPREELHLTLAFLGDALDWSPAQRNALVERLRTLLQEGPGQSVEAEVFGAAHWNVGTDTPSWVLNVGGEDIEDAYGLAWEALRGAETIPELPEQHAPFSAHLCVAYSGDPGLVEQVEERVGPVTFDRLRIAFGPRVVDLPLESASQEGQEPRSATLGTRHPETPAELSAPASVAEGRRDDPAERRARTWRAVDREVRLLEGQWERAWRGFFDRQERNTLDRLTNQRRGRQFIRDAAEVSGAELRAPIVSRIFDPLAWAERAVEFLTGLYESVVSLGAARVAGQFDVDPGDLGRNADVQAFIRDRSSWLARQVNETTFRQITDALGEGVEEGEGIDDLADRVRSVFAEARDNRARLIARTSVISSFNAAQEMTARQVATDLGEDVVHSKEWVATLTDDRTRPDHREADGQVVAIGAAFRVGESLMAYPGAPTAPPEQILNCRCTLSFLDREAAEERNPRRVMDIRDALRVLDLVAAGAITDVARYLEVTAA